MIITLFDTGETVEVPMSMGQAVLRLEVGRNATIEEVIAYTFIKKYGRMPLIEKDDI